MQATHTNKNKLPLCFTNIFKWPKSTNTITTSSLNKTQFFKNDDKDNKYGHLQSEVHIRKKN